MSSEGLVSRIKKHEITSPLILAVFVACMGSIQYGYHIAELNAPQQVMTCNDTKYPNGDPTFSYDDSVFGNIGLKQCIPMTTEQFGIVTSVFSVGGLFGSYIAGQLSVKYGRRLISEGTCVLAFIGSLMLASANGFWMMVFARILVGIAAGISIVVTPLFINEITPVQYRGAMGTMNQLCINIGILVTQSLALVFTDSYYWRWILFFAAGLALLNLFFWFQIDESPKWLLKAGKPSEAEIVTYRLHGGTYQDARETVQKWQKDLSSPSDAESTRKEGPTMWEYVTKLNYRKSRNVIMIILCAQQFCGINSIIFYGVKVISESLPDQAVKINFGISILNVIVTLIASIIIDHVGRKPLLLSSSSLMGFTSLLISVGITKDKSILLVLSVFAYIAAFAIGLGPIPFLIIGELSAPDEAARAQSFGTICNWLATFAIGFSFPVVHEMLGGKVYIIFSVVAVAFAIYVKNKVPETKNKASFNDVWRNY
ncbi:Vvs1p RNJ42_02064 [Nakaseomyces bracarensis]|uniref:Vvs1p n=1 Tax=Nakaseomyces bracarensis TaxID=273131 RepID=UPI003871C4F0